MHITVTHKVVISDAPRAVKTSLKEKFTIPNPAYASALRGGRRIYGIPRNLELYETASNGDMLLPRGCAQEIIDFCKNLEPGLPVAAKLTECEPVLFSFTGSLKPYQQKAVDVMRSTRSGVLNAPTGSGKTVIGLALVAERRQTALILVHTEDLLHQWMDRIEEFLGIPKEEIGVISGRSKKWEGKQIAVGIVYSVGKITAELAPHYGHVLVDECHRTPGRTFTKVVSELHPLYLTGLSATPTRRDGLTKLIFWFVGPQRHAVSRQELIASNDLLNAEVHFRVTQFSTRLNASNEYAKVIRELTRDESRNQMIVADVLHVKSKESGTILILSDRTEHCDRLAEMLKEKGVESTLLYGKLKKSVRENIPEQIASGEIKVLIATGQLIGEGFDAKQLTVLFLVTPIRFNGRLRQYIGRVLRIAEGKKRAVVYDYADMLVGQLKGSAIARKGIYKEMGARTL